MSHLSENDKKILLESAKTSILSGMEFGKPLEIQASQYSPSLQEKRASFVTLELEGDLRGCIGVLEPIRPLIRDVVENAYAAAFEDPRFMPVTKEEFPFLEISLSILSLPEKINFSSEENLLSQIRPGVDGLIITDGRHRGTFLPSVWEQLPDVKDFWRHLKGKAGLPENYWSSTIKVERYSTQSIP
ncbi:MAG: AmmeMemoRadiSam system protein A [Deltaproteobacteria bacterium]|nr:MAG: AmmeMemoRadiSam system protein A [Deltaproteobacteria bacterium]